MKHRLAPLALCLMLLPAYAQEPPETETDQGLDLMQKGADLLLRGLMSQMEPAIKDMQGALTEMQPALSQLIEMIGDFRNYGAPIRQPNGDILIPRKVPLPTQPGKPPEIEL